MGRNHSLKIVTNSITGCFDAENPKLGTPEILDLVHQQPVGGNQIKMIVENAVSYSSTTPKYYTFDGIWTTGTSAYVQSYPNFVSNPTTDFTLEIMLRPTNLTGLHAICSDIGSAEYTFMFNTNQLGIQNSSYILSLFSTPSTLTTNKWYHIVFTNSSSTLAAYCNGIPQGSISGSFTNGDIGLWAIGTDALGYVDPFVGNFSFFRSYSKILSAAEIQQNFNATRGRFGI